MKEIKAIIDGYDHLDRHATQAALATVVRVEGSSYRRTGARMLVMSDGLWIGGISGGCLEGDALKRARLAIAKASPSKITYDTTTDDEHQIGVGLGCNGIIDVLFTPLDFTDKKNPVEVLKNCMNERRQTHVLITITGLEGNWPSIKEGEVIRYTNSASLDVLDHATLQAQLDEKIQARITKGVSAPYRFDSPDGQELDVFIEILSPEIHLVLWGHQYDVYPLTRLVKELGWRVTVVANPLKVNKKIVALVDEIVLPENFSTILFDAHTAVVLMTHDYKSDKQNLPKVLSTNAPYIGMLGPRVRSERIWAELADEGNPIDDADFSRIHAPVGLDIGAVSPEEIALSLAAEIRADFSSRNGTFLRLRESTIHVRE
ncbi:XdhC family protein [Spirosoma pollinicola]|uniref:XshC-Cox1 family protein n=1 Tax=Spirosoma pollinicola TaxID=2057025 RepID=A0A2K8YUI5_9BACT|nr:XdhC/CoxI family protein [Spirosoma pollinicola]AUD01218.1 XshC-Cox1 family protein [Spirosoma pollinicola]